MIIVYFKRSFFLFLILMTITAPYASGQRNLDTPQNRLVGHWLLRPDKVHYYFSPVNESDKTGILTMSFPANFDDKNLAGTDKILKYAIVFQEPSGEKFKIKIDPENVWTDGKASQNVFYVIVKNGKNMRTGFFNVPSIGDVLRRDYSLTYVDNKVFPGEAK